MQATRVDVKFFVSPSSKIEPSELVSVFHGFIQRAVITDEVIIDVADYSHVVDGPGVLLIGHDGQYGFEQNKGRTGLLYSQRRAKVDGFENALVCALRRALRMCWLLEHDAALEGRLVFDGQQLVVRINDRLLAPNTIETWKAVEPKARVVLGKLFGGPCSMEPAPPSAELFTLDAKAATAASVDTLLARLPS